MSDVIVPPPAPAPTPATAPAGLFDRTIRRIASAWRDNIWRDNIWRDMASGVSNDEGESIAAQMRACLDGRGGEVSARNRAAKLAHTYLGLDEAERVEFLRLLAGFDADPAAVAHAADAVRQGAGGAAEGAADGAARARANALLRRALEAPRVRLLTQFATIPDGMKFLVDLRAFLLGVAKGDLLLGALEADLRGLLGNWFDVAFLDLARIDWSSSAALLEKLVGYEAVHEIRSWRDLKNRLDSDRRCYGFFHPRMPGEPLIFVEVALVQGLAGSVQGLLDRRAPLLDPGSADTAIFYSISNCQRGLSGISFGNFLIKRVVELLAVEYRNLRTFATLSPMPGFAAWLDETLAADEPGLLSDEEAAALRLGAPPELPAPPTAAGALAAILTQRGWWREPSMRRAAEPVLVRLASLYLLHAPHGANRRRARDPVAHFHLSNGARVERISALADTSGKGVRESATLMVNYLYDPARIEDYHEDYAGEGRRNASAAVRKLARLRG